MVAQRLAAIGALHLKKLLRNPIDTVIRATLNTNMERWTWLNITDIDDCADMHGRFAETKNGRNNMLSVRRTYT